MTRVLVCTPTYNEATNISELLHRVREALPGRGHPRARRQQPGRHRGRRREGRRPRSAFVEVLRRPDKRGLGDAYRAGFAVGIARDYDVIVQIDADLSHDPAVLPELDRRARRRCRPRDRVAVRPGWVDAVLAVAAQGAVALRQPLRRVHAAHERARQLRRVPGVQGERRSRRSSTRPRGRRATGSSSS